MKPVRSIEKIAFTVQISKNHQDRLVGMILLEYSPACQRVPTRSRLVINNYLSILRFQDQFIRPGRLSAS